MNLIRFLTLNPDNDYEMIGLGVLALLAAFLVIHHVSIAMGSKMADRTRSVMILLMIIIPVLLITAAVNLYCVPKIANETARKWLPPVVAAITILATGVPACRIVNKIKWSSSSVVVLLAAVAVWGVTLLGSSAIGAVKATCKQLNKSFEHQEERQNAIPR